jgi:hypothetical protein
MEPTRVRHPLRETEDGVRPLPIPRAGDRVLDNGRSCRWSGRRREENTQPAGIGGGNPTDKTAADLPQFYRLPILQTGAARPIRAALYSKKSIACTTLSLDHKALVARVSPGHLQAPIKRCHQQLARHSERGVVIVPGNFKQRSPCRKAVSSTATPAARSPTAKNPLQTLAPRFVYTPPAKSPAGGWPILRVDATLS